MDGTAYQQPRACRMPLSSELGTHTPVKARFWPWRQPLLVRKPLKPFKVFPLRSVAIARISGS